MRRLVVFASESDRSLPMLLKPLQGPSLAFYCLLYLLHIITHIHNVQSSFLLHNRLATPANSGPLRHLSPSLFHPTSLTYLTLTGDPLPLRPLCSSANSAVCKHIFPFHHPPLFLLCQITPLASRSPIPLLSTTLTCPSQSTGIITEFLLRLSPSLSLHTSLTVSSHF